MVDSNRKVPDLYFKVVDPKLQVADLKAEVGDLRSGGIPQFNPCTQFTVKDIIDWCKASLGNLSRTAQIKTQIIRKLKFKCKKYFKIQ